MSTEVKTETLGFQAEVKQILNLVTHSLYSHKEIFLRELISNASDAADRLRFQALAKPELYENDPNLKIIIDIDKQSKTLTITDNGIGMSRDEVVQHIGTIARSGTKEFVQSLTGDQSKDSNLIGQFGVGFYSAFIVADSVTLKTRQAGAPASEGVCWHSKGEGEYTLTPLHQAARGTEITLHLKEAEGEFLEAYRLKSIIRKYSDHISLPIQMRKESMSDDALELDDPQLDADENNETHAKKEAKVKAEPPEYETVNKAQALWTQPKKDIADEQYQEFYKHISHDFRDALTWSHNRVEGKLEYTSLLYIPAHAPFDLWQQNMHKGIKLFVQRVFIMDEADQFLPNYLRFVKGVVDTTDLPLNVSRELLQNHPKIESIRTALTKRILEMLAQIALDEPEKYKTFWKEFGSVIKEGPAEDFMHRDKISKLLRFATTHDDSAEQNVSLEEYVKRMQPKQEVIYFITAETLNAAKHSPHLEVFRKKGIEVLLLSDRVDEWLVMHLHEFEGKKLQNVAKGDIHLEDSPDEETKKAQDEKAKEFEGMLAHAKKILDTKVKEVRLTNRLTDSPACLVADEDEMSSQLQRMMQAAGQKIPETKPILELNPEHVLIRRLHDEQDDEQFANWSLVLFDQALLAEGGQLDDPGSYVKRLNHLLVG